MTFTNGRPPRHRAERPGLRRRRVAGCVGLVAAVVVAAIAAPTGAGASTRRALPSASDPGYKQTIRIAVSDIQDFWDDEFRAVYGARYVPIPRNRVIAGRPGVRIPSCQGQRLSYRDVEDNAFYCFRDNFIAYDDAGLFRDLHDDVGAFAIGLVLAHEWGHAIQDRAGELNRPTIHMELQADCFAGAWTADVARDPDDVPYAAGDLEVALAALIRFRDAPGSSPDDSSAHGSAFDRVSAFQEGFQFGAQRCAEYFVDPPLVVQVPFGSAQDEARGGDVPAEEVIPLTVELLNDFYSQVEPRYAPLSTDDIQAFDSSKPRTIPRCGASRPSVAQVRNRVYFCIDDGYIAFDEPFLQQIYDDIGDFGVATLIANPWATHVQVDQGIPGVVDNDLTAVLQADCYTGGWAAAFYNGFLSGGSLSPGDLDEFVQAFLVYSRARGVSADVPITFVRVHFFRQGFREGYQSCGYDAVRREVAAL
jgi:predicted metalloprotease